MSLKGLEEVSEEDRIVRQHDLTTMDEVHGQICEEFFSVCYDGSKSFNVFFIKLSGVFHRFFLDAGLLFWRSHRPLEPEDDLDPEDTVVDIGGPLNVIGVPVVMIKMMENCCLEIQFENGVGILMKEGVFETDLKFVICPWKPLE